MSLHFDPIERLSALQSLGGIYIPLLEGQGLALDRVQDDINICDKNLIVDSIDNEYIFGRWEYFHGITPDPGDSIYTRRQRIISYMADTGGLSKSFFLSIAEALGYEIRIEDPVRPFRVGVSRIGDPIFDLCEGFRALVGEFVTYGIAILSTDRSDEYLHSSHNEEEVNIRLYEDDAEVRQWVFKVVFINETFESAKLLIDKFIKIKPAFTFMEVGFETLLAYDIDEGAGILSEDYSLIDSGAGSSIFLNTNIDSGSGILV